MQFKVLQQEGIQLSGSLVGSTISIEYTAMLYEQPANNNCFLSVWQDMQIPFGKAGDPTSLIIGNERTGSQTFQNLTTDVPYIIGWGAGSKEGTSDPNYGSIGASLQFVPGGDDDKNGVCRGSLHQNSITPVVVGQNSIVATFETLDGNNPKNNGNWIGLWNGSYVDFHGEYLQKWDVTSKLNNDSQGLNTNEPIRSGATYTLALASGPLDSDIVARVTFKTEGY